MARCIRQDSHIFKRANLALDDPVVLLALPLLVVLIAYQFFRRGKRMKHDGLQSLGLVIVTLGVIVLIFFEFLVAFVFFATGILIFMSGEFVSKITS